MESDGKNKEEDRKNKESDINSKESGINIKESGENSKESGINRMRKFAIIFSICYLVVLLGFGVYVILDAMVIPHRISVVSDGAETGNGAGTGNGVDNNSDNENTVTVLSDGSLYETNADVTVTDNYYKDSDVEITITDYREYDTNIYVADIKIADISHFKTMFAQNSYGLNVREVTSRMALESGAILAINGDFYGARESGYVIRNGVLYRDTVYKDGDTGKVNSALILYADGSMDSVTEGEVSAQSLLEDGAIDVWSFGPTLIKNNEILVSETEEVGQAMSSNPRNAIVYLEPLHYLFIVSDGRTDASAGLTLYQMAQFIEDNFNAPFAFNMDGGGSATMVFNGKVVNVPATSSRNLGEREVSDMVYIK